VADELIAKANKMEIDRRRFLKATGAAALLSTGAAPFDSAHEAQAADKPYFDTVIYKEVPTSGARLAKSKCSSLPHRSAREERFVWPIDLWKSLPRREGAYRAAAPVCLLQREG
jgi:hypothetical protein